MSRERLEGRAGSETSSEIGNSTSPPPTTGTSPVENTSSPSANTALQSSGTLQNSWTRSTQESLPNRTHSPSWSAISELLSLSHDRIINQHYPSLRNFYLLQAKTVQADEVAETQSIPEALPVRLETPSTQAKKSTQSQLSSIPETELDSNRNLVISQKDHELDSHTQFSVSVSLRHTQHSNSGADPILCRRITPSFPASQNHFIKTPAIMENNPDNNGPPRSDIPERYHHVPGSTPREKLKNMYSQLQASFPRPLQSASASATPSSAGDIEPAAASVPETTSPLSIRVDKEPASHAAPVDIHDQPGQEYTGAALSEYHEGPLMQTIQPSDLTVGPAEEAPPGSVQLGPSEFAMTLSMDSRVKDEYERILTNESHVIKNFHSLFTPEATIGDNEVS